jgi:hypothetical protein
LGAGEVGEGGDVGCGEGLGDGVGDSPRGVAGGEDGDADVEFWDEREESAVRADAAEFVVGVDKLVCLVFLDRQLGNV